MQKLVIVCGLPGSGKTTLAKALSKKLNIVCLHKDSIKENLYDILRLSTLEDSKRLGLQSIKLLYKLAEEQLANDVDLIIEAPFYFEEDYKIFRNWETKYKLKIYSIICTIDEKEQVRRFRKRDRHKAHHDAERTIGEDKRKNTYKNLPGKVIKIHTSEPVSKLVKDIGKLLK